MRQHIYNIDYVCTSEFTVTKIVLQINYYFFTKKHINPFRRFPFSLSYFTLYSLIIIFIHFPFVSSFLFVLAHHILPNKKQRNKKPFFFHFSLFSFLLLYIFDLRKKKKKSLVKKAVFLAKILSLFFFHKQNLNKSLKQNLWRVERILRKKNCYNYSF